MMIKLRSRPAIVPKDDSYRPSDNDDVIEQVFIGKDEEHLQLAGELRLRRDEVGPFEGLMAVGGALAIKRVGISFERGD